MEKLEYLNDYVPSTSSLTFPNLPVAPKKDAVFGSPEYLRLLEEMRELHIKKNTGYAGAGKGDPWYNFRQCETFGISALDGIITRMSDKWSRIQSLWRKPERNQINESIEDTLMDLAAYSLILICMLREGKSS